jgi:hypothetical protein
VNTKYDQIHTPKIDGSQSCVAFQRRREQSDCIVAQLAVYRECLQCRQLLYDFLHFLIGNAAQFDKFELVSIVVALVIVVIVATNTRIITIIIIVVIVSIPLNVNYFPFFSLLFLSYKHLKNTSLKPHTQLNSPLVVSSRPQLQR